MKKVAGENNGIGDGEETSPTSNPMNPSLEEVSEEKNAEAREVFECFKKRRFYQKEEENAKEQSAKIENILGQVREESRSRIVNWHHDKVYTHLLTLQQ